MNALRRSLFFLYLAGIASCTSITVQGSAVVHQSYWFAPVQISFATSDAVATVFSEGIGLVPSVNGVVFGYSREVVFFANDPSACRAIIILKDKTAIDGFTDFLKKSQGSLNNICLVNSWGEYEKN